MSARARRLAPFQVLQWQHAVKLEAIGLRHSSGRSVRKHACQMLGLPTRTPHAEVSARCAALVAEAKALGLPLTQPHEVTTLGVWRRTPCETCGPDPLADRPCVRCGQ